MLPRQVALSHLEVYGCASTHHSARPTPTSSPRSLLDMTSDDPTHRARNKSRVVAVALVLCAALLAPAAVPAAASSLLIIAVGLVLFAVACVAIAARLV